MQKIYQLSFFLSVLFATACAVFPLQAEETDRHNIQVVTSPGGVEAWLIENHDIPVLSLSFAFRGGVSEDPDQAIGATRLMSALLTQGAGPYEATAFQRQLSDAAIYLSFDTGYDEISGSLKTTTQYLDQAASLLQLALTEPHFAQDDVPRIKNELEAEIRLNTQSPDWIATRVLYQTLYPDHPYGRPSRGTLPQLQALTIEDLQNRHRQALTRDRLIVSAVGDITAEELAERLDQIFGELPAQPESPPPQVVRQAIDSTNSLTIVARPGPQTVVMIAQPGITRQDPDFYAAMILNEILGGGFGSRLMEEIREERGLSYGIGSSLITRDHSEFLFISSDISNENVGLAVGLIQEELQRLQDEGIREEELTHARTQLIGRFALQLTSTDRIAAILTRLQLEGLSPQYFRERRDLLTAVSREDVNRLAADLLRPNQLVRVIVGEPEGLSGPARHLTAQDVAAEEIGEAR